MSETNFTTEEKEKFFIIKFPPNWDRESSSIFDKKSAAWLLNTKPVVIFDFSSVKTIEMSHVRSLLLFSKQIRSNKKSLYTVASDENVKHSIQHAGCGQAFCFVNSLSDVHMEVDTQSEKAKMLDVKFINPFIDAAITTMELQCGTKATAKSLFIKNNANIPPVEIAGVISLICDQFSGSISLCFTNEVFLKIYEAMVGEKHLEINSEIQDAASELLNIIYGTAKSRLNSEFKTNLKPAIPTVLTGENIRIHKQSLGPTIVVPLESNNGNFHIEIAIDHV